MKLAYSTCGWRRAPIDEVIRRLADIGYHGVEISIQPHMLPPRAWSSKEARRLRRLADDLGMLISNLHLGSANLLSKTPHEPSFMAVYPSQRDERTGLICQSLDFAAELGVDLVCFESGPLPPHLSPSAGMDFLIEGLSQCLDRAAQRRVRIGLEPAPEHLISGYSAYVDLWNYFDGHPSLGLCLDIGHSYCFYEDTPAVIHDTPEIFHVHIKDISDRMQRHLVPGEGEIDLAGALEALAGAEFEGFVSVELMDPGGQPERAARKSISALLEWLQQARGRPDPAGPASRKPVRTIPAESNGIDSSHPLGR